MICAHRSTVDQLLIRYYFPLLDLRTSFAIIDVNMLYTIKSMMMTKQRKQLKRNNQSQTHLHIMQSTAKKLGYTKKMWNGDKEPDCCDEYWDDLDEDQRQAATVLGYDKESWDKGGILDKCCVIL
eukprot:scaffold364_cov111-Skeletonema_marinoi.AAC.2